MWQRVRLKHSIIWNSYSLYLPVFLFLLPLPIFRVLPRPLSERCSTHAQIDTSTTLGFPQLTMVTNSWQITATKSSSRTSPIGVKLWVHRGETSCTTHKLLLLTNGGRYGNGELVTDAIPHGWGRTDFNMAEEQRSATGPVPQNVPQVINAERATVSAQ